MTTPNDKPIATRRLLVIGEPSKMVTVSMAQPRPDPDPSGDWICSIRIEGLHPTPTQDEVHGVDAFQAMLLALDRIRSLIEASKLALSMDGKAPANTGFPRMTQL